MKTYETALCPKCGGEIKLSYKEEELTCPACQVKLVATLNKKGHRVIRAAESRIKPKAEKTAPASAPRPRANPAQRAAAIQRVLFSIVAIIIVLSMILALIAM